jgi:hypothetical protein
MFRVGVTACGVFAALLCSSARADPIQITSFITSGSADVIPGSAQFSLFEPEVSFTGAGRSTAGPCIIGCLPGTSVTGAIGVISSEDWGLSGTVTLDGVSHVYQFAPGLSGDALLEFSYVLPIPDVGATTLSLTTPFTAGAFFSSPVLGLSLHMVGGGVATVNLELGPSSPFYTLQSAHYDFVSPVPEPSTITLALVGFAGWVICRRKRKALSSPRPEG